MRGQLPGMSKSMLLATWIYVFAKVEWCSICGPTACPAPISWLVEHILTGNCDNTNDYYFKFHTSKIYNLTRQSVIDKISTKDWICLFYVEGSLWFLWWIKLQHVMSCGFFSLLISEEIVTFMKAVKQCCVTVASLFTFTGNYKITCFNIKLHHYHVMYSSV